MEKIQPHQFPREEIGGWLIPKSGLSARVVHCLEQTGVKTIGQLRGWSDQQLLNLANFGTTSLENVRWFFNWTRRVEAGNAEVANAPAWLRGVLHTPQVFLIGPPYRLA